MRDIDRLRAEVRARQQAANRKLRRIENLGIDIRGSQYDPTTHGRDISKMRTRDLNRLKSQLNSFVSRGTQFVPMSGRAPLPRKEWRKYKIAEQKANRKADRLESNISKIKMPGSDATLGQRHAYATDTKFPKTANHTVNSPLRRHERVPTSIASEKALRRLTKQQQDKVDPQFLKQFVKRGRSEAKKMLDAIGDSALQKELSKLTNKQFHILWAYTEFATLQSIRYENGNMPQGGRGVDETNEGSIKESKQWIEWAKKIDSPNPNAIKIHTSTKAGLIDIP